jgi:D-arabinose 5-phosphate isomerase GutQ
LGNEQEHIVWIDSSAGEGLNTSAASLVARARAVVEREAQAVQALADQFDESLAGVIDLMLNCQGHVLVAGAGTSHAMAQRFAHLLSCSGTPALCINAADSLHGGAGAVTAQDVIFVISKGGHSAEINQFVEIARQRGAKVVAQTENPDSPLAHMSDAVFNVRAVGDVDPYGMIATGSSLVNGAAGDAICVSLLELQGYSQEEFGETHPGGAVGKKLAEPEQ